MNEAITKPGNFFDDASFKTLYGGVVITWVSTNAICDIFGAFDPKMTGFIIALIVALVGFFVSDQRNLRKLVITPFNGLLIYLTIMGGTSFLPPPRVPPVENNVAATASAGSKTSSGTSGKETLKSHFLFQWNPDEKLAKQALTLSKEKQTLVNQNAKLIEANRNYETKLKTTQTTIQHLSINPQVKNALMQNLQFTPVVVHPVN